MPKPNESGCELHGDFHYQYGCFITFAIAIMFLVGCVLISFWLAGLSFAGIPAKIMRLTSPALLIMLLLSLPVKFMVSRSELTLKDGVLSGTRQSLFPRERTRFAIPVSAIREVSYLADQLEVKTDQETFRFQFLRNSIRIGDELNRLYLPYEQARLARRASIPIEPVQQIPQNPPQEPAFTLPQAPSEALPYVEIPLPQQDDIGALLSQQNPQNQAPDALFRLSGPETWGQPEQNEADQENQNGTAIL